MTYESIGDLGVTCFLTKSIRHGAEGIFKQASEIKVYRSHGILVFFANIISLLSI